LTFSERVKRMLA